MGEDSSNLKEVSQNAAKGGGWAKGQGHPRDPLENFKLTLALDIIYHILWQGNKED